jgi:resuscitation-promoting factor RpfB
MTIKGASVAYVVIGGVLIYSGIKGSSISDTAKSVLSGSVNVSDTEALSTGATASTPATATTTGGSDGAGDTPNNESANQALAKTLATKMGFGSWTTGQAWDDWVKLWNQESGWSITAANKTSDARGIAQNINGYGPDYLEGNATSQITWGINYIAGRYGSPVAAWAHEVENNWY